MTDLLRSRSELMAAVRTGYSPCRYFAPVTAAVRLAW